MSNSIVNIAALCFCCLVYGNWAAAAEIPELEIPELEPPACPNKSEILQTENYDEQLAIGLRLAVDGSKAFRHLKGQGMTCVVIDTGLNKNHIDFQENRVVTEVNLTLENGANPASAADLDGHGTHVAGIIAASGQHQGIAPAARIIPIKIVVAKGGPSVNTTHDRLLEALNWVIDNHEEFEISVVNVSIADRVLRKDDIFKRNDTRWKIRNAIKELRKLDIPVVVAAGNNYSSENSSDLRKVMAGGMEFPAIIRETISVGALYQGDPKKERFHQNYNAKSFNRMPLQIAPFSSRLFIRALGPDKTCATDIFAPGGDLYVSTGRAPDGSSHFEQGGTSQAAPFVTGAVLLLQQFWKEDQHKLPEVEDIERWLRDGGVTIWDGDDEYDNVRHTLGQFRALNVLGALIQAQSAIKTSE